MAGANWISGISSGLDWRSTIEQLRQVEHKSIDIVSTRKSNYEKQLKAWQEFNTKLLALKSSAEGLNTASDFNLFSCSLSSSSSTDADDLISMTAGSSASKGSHSVEVLQTARAQKLSSESFASQSTALGTSFAGDVLINGKALTISSIDTLVDVRDRINSLNSGDTPSKITASIVSYSSSDYRLILTSQTEGAAGMGVQQAGSTNVLQNFGFISSTNTIKNTTSDGAKTDSFTSSGTGISSLLGLGSSPTGNVTIGGQAVTIDLSKTLTQIASDIDALAGVTAQVISTTEDGETTYQLDISGTTSFTDSNNVLQSLGILKGTNSSTQEIHLSDTANTKTTAAGGGVITAGTKWSEINTGSDANNVTNGDTITISGVNHSGTSVSGTYTITDKAVDTVQGLLTQIETVFGLTAGSAVITAEGKIQVTDSTTGDSALGITLNANNQGGGDLNLGTITASQQGYTMELQSGRDALIKIDGNYMSRTSNTITDGIPGVTLNLKKAEVGTTVNVDINRDISGLTSLIKGMVDKYNIVASYIHSQSTYDSESNTAGGVLFGDGTLKSVKSDLMGVLVNKVWGVSSEFSIPGLIGINLDNDGKLTVNDSVLQGYLQTNFEDVKKMFIANASASVGTLDYTNHGTKTKAGTYTVNITQAATQGSVTGTTDLSAGLGGAESLTISVGTASAGVNLTGGMTLSQIVSNINSELDKSYAEVIVGNKSLYANAGMTAKISNSTTWANVYDDTGISAGLIDGDVISFSGTDRSGTAIAGTYTISSTATDTVQGLLSAIETAYDNTVIASIDSNGKISLSDKTTGPSSISLSISNPVGRNLNFGTVDVDPTGTDGSKEGRYAIQVTASASADNKYLVLNHDSYGTANSFTVTQTNNLVLGAGANGTYTGVDVAGTINGEAATGSGQRLTGSSGDANVDGLAITYSGTSTGNVGSVTLTLGLAESLYNKLYYITDAEDGYVSFKQTSISDNVTRLSKRIDDMEARLDRRMVSLTNQYIAMEKALGQMQNQSSWLSSQIKGLQS